MIGVEMPTGEVWYVAALRFPTATEAEDRWHEIEDEAKEKEPGETDCSIWRTTTPNGEVNLIVLVGPYDAIERLGEVGAEEFDLDDRSAFLFVQRRLRTAFEAFADGERDAFSQEAHYGEQGARLQVDGTAVPR